MKIKRINSHRGVDREADVIVIEHEGAEYTITQEFDKLVIMKIDFNDDKHLSIIPSCSNVVLIK